MEPKVTLLDEPLSALDLKLRQHMRSELRAIQKRTAVTFTYITGEGLRGLFRGREQRAARAGGGSRKRLRTGPYAGQFVHARLGPGIGVGDAAKLYVRPENARIVPVADSADALAVRVDDVAFEGSHINVHAQDGAAVATGSRSATSRAHRCRRSPPPST